MKNYKIIIVDPKNFRTKIKNCLLDISIKIEH